MRAQKYEDGVLTYIDPQEGAYDHTTKAQHDYEKDCKMFAEEDQRYEMERICYGCEKPFPRIELTDVRDDEAYCKICFEGLEVKGQMEYQRQKEEDDV